MEGGNGLGRWGAGRGGVGVYAVRWDPQRLTGAAAHRGYGEGGGAWDRGRKAGGTVGRPARGWGGGSLAGSPSVGGLSCDAAVDCR